MAFSIQEGTRELKLVVKLHKDGSPTYTLVDIASGEPVAGVVNVDGETMLNKFWTKVTILIRNIEVSALKEEQESA